MLQTIRIRAAEAASGLGKAGAVRLGIGDDCALLRARGGEELAVTTDLSIEGRHFRLDLHPPESVGHRTLVRGLSDLAAMGAKPLAAFLSLGLPRALTVSEGKGGTKDKAWIERFLDGLLAAAAKHGVPLAGGDLAESPTALADIVLIGSAPRGKALLRSGARAGDAIYVTGSLGGAAAELEQLMLNPKRWERATSAMPGHPHLYPEPRLKQGLWLRTHAASAALDLSDGISTDLDHLCEDSGVAAEIDSGLIPLGTGATLEMALSGGEDYELLFTAPADVKMPRRIAGVPVSRIGWMVKQSAGRPRVSLTATGKTQPLRPRGWEHFSRSQE